MKTFPRISTEVLRLSADMLMCKPPSHIFDLHSSRELTFGSQV